MEKEKEVELLAIVKKNYSEIAIDFDRTRKKRLWPELLKLALKVESGERVLDAGCGNGHLLEALRGKNISYFGFDSSRELISLARKNYPEKEFIVADILDQPVISGFFDKIFCIAVIPHIPGKKNRAEVLRFLYNKLSVGGEMIVSFWDLRSQRAYRWPIFLADLKKFFSLSSLDYGDLLFNWRGKKKSRRYYHAFKEKELKELVSSAGLDFKELYRADNNFWLIIKKD